jgi:hypothetical protein
MRGPTSGDPPAWVSPRTLRIKSAFAQGRNGASLPKLNSPKGEQPEQKSHFLHGAMRGDAPLS